MPRNHRWIVPRIAVRELALPCVQQQKERCHEPVARAVFRYRLIQYSHQLAGAIPVFAEDLEAPLEGCHHETRGHPFPSNICYHNSYAPVTVVEKVVIIAAD